MTPQIPNVMDKRASRAGFGGRLLLTLGVSLAVFGPLSVVSSAAPEAGVFPANNDTTGKAKADQYSAWLGTDVKYILQFYAGSNWNEIDGTASSGLNWWSNQWVNYSQDVKDKLVIAIPILPSYDANNDHQPDDGSTLAAGATGAYNQRWINAANKLVARGMQNATLRLGWEFNGGWYTWNALGGRATHFKNYWIQIVNSMRSVPGQNFKFCWNPSMGDFGLNAMTAYPGAAYVDSIGLDLYDNYSGYGTTDANGNVYPNLPGWQVTSIRNNGWLSQKEWGNYPLDWWKAQAATAGKPLCFPEWGLDNPKPNTGHAPGGQDNTVFLTKFQQWINNPANNVSWHAYFEAGSGTATRNHMIFFASQYPNAKAIFPSLFGAKFNDDFTAGTTTNWTPTQPTQWSVVSDAGNNTYKFDFNWSSDSGTSTAGNVAWTNYRLLAEIKVTDMQSWSDNFLYVRYLDANNHYRLAIQETGGSRKFLLQKRVGGVYSNLGSAVGVTFNANTWYDVAVDATGSTLTAYLNGVQILQRTDTSHTAGKIGLGARKQDVLFDSVSVQ
jgi:hypothetical protein